MRGGKALNPLPLVFTRAKFFSNGGVRWGGLLFLVKSRATKH
nr:MAG TPA: hypothetical protein [Caudoviricetes sp.]